MSLIGWESTSNLYEMVLLLWKCSDEGFQPWQCERVCWNVYQLVRCLRCHRTLSERQSSGQQLVILLYVSRSYGQDKTVLSYLVLFCLVRVGGVNRIGDKSRLSATENFETVLSCLEIQWRLLIYDWKQFFLIAKLLYIPIQKVLLSVLPTLKLLANMYGDNTIQLDINSDRRTRGHTKKLLVKRCRYDVRKYSFSNRITCLLYTSDAADE